MTRAAPLPTGAVTFAFTDIEGSTVRWDRNRPAMQEAVRKHDAILRAAIEEHGGHVFKTIGDAFCCAFARADSAIAAVVAAQRRLAAEDFEAVDGLRVRMALHTGFADERDDDYFGPTLNRVARLLAIGHGGQILVSTATRELAHTHLPTGAHLVDLGFQQLRDLIETERVWQLNAVGLPHKFPALRSVGAFPNNLPVQRASFVGRDDEITDVKKLLQQHRMLTLLGSGGVGKTSLAVHVGAEVLDRYRDGVWFVDLAPIGDPQLVASVTSQALGMSQGQGGRVEDAIPEWLRSKQVLLILDNCEHVVDAAAALASAILVTAQDVSIVATSRQTLNINGEARYRLPSLGVPANTAGLTADDALTYGAVALFVDRARAVDTRFTLSDDTAPVVADICRRLDGIALAIELAAARIRMLSLSNLAQRLNERFKILSGGGRDVLPRQKTLMALIDWSYDLLTPDEQMLFKRVGIFAGGFTLEAAAAVGGSGDLDEIEILDLLSSLTDKSLVVADTSAESERYHVLESTRAYAIAKLMAAGEHEQLARRHAEYFHDQARAADERCGYGSMLAWIADVELELDNDRTALEWALARGNDAVLGGTIAGALGRFWGSAGVSVEGRYWIELALERLNEAEHPQVVARLWQALSALSVGQRMQETAERALRLYISAGDTRGVALALRNLAFALFQMGRLDEAKATNEQALAAARSLGDSLLVAVCLDVQATIEMRRGDTRAARELYAEALAAHRVHGNETGISTNLSNLAELEFQDGHPQLALRAASEALEIDARSKNAIYLAIDHANCAIYRIALGELDAARDSARGALHLARQVQDPVLTASVLQQFALLLALREEASDAARFLGYVNVQYESLGFERDGSEKWVYDKLVTALREKLNGTEIQSLTAEGAQLTEDQAIAEAMAV